MHETHFYFVRHGETDHNRKGVVQGRGVNPSLNETGHLQVEALAQRLQDLHLDAIYSSPLQRALETAEVVRRYHPKVPFYTLEQLEEMSWGIYEGMAFSPAMRQQFDGYHARWQSGEFDFRIEGGESILDVQKRALEAVDHLLAHHKGQTVLVVTHGRFLRVALASLLDTYGLIRMQDIHHANASVNHLVWQDGLFRAERLNCTAHLEASSFSTTE